MLINNDDEFHCELRELAFVTERGKETKLKIVMNIHSGIMTLEI